MRYTVPQMKLLKEGELYGHYTKGGQGWRNYGQGSDSFGDPIDQLVNLVQAEFIDWDLSNSKFMALFNKTHPWADDAYLEEMGGIKQVLLDELEGSNQTEQLVHTLIKKTQESGRTGPSILDVPASDLDLSVRGTRSLEAMNINTIGELVSTPKEELLQYKYLGRITIKEFGRKVAEFVDNSRRNAHGFNIPPEVEAKITKWVNSAYAGRSDKPWAPYKPDYSPGSTFGKMTSQRP